MSFEAVSWALEAPVSGTQKVVLIGIASHADKFGDNAWPSIETLAGYAYVDARSVQRAIGDLIKAGFVTKLVNEGGNRQTASHMRPNLYRLNMEKTPVKHPLTPASPPDTSVTTPLTPASPLPLTPASPEPSIEPSLNHPLNTSARKRACRQPAVQCPDGVDQQVWNDWLALRKEKRASVTQTVIEGAMGEAEKAGMTFEDFLRVWCRRGTQGLEAAWLKPYERTATAARSHPQPKSFAQQEREAGWARWEQQTNRQHPDRLAYEARNGGGVVIDMQTATSQQSRISQ